MEAITLNTNGSTGTGKIISVRGSVVDIRFEEHLPPIYTLLNTGSNEQIPIEVLSHLDAKSVRGIALTPTQGLARGMVVKNTEGPLKAPIGKGIISRMFEEILVVRTTEGAVGEHQSRLSAATCATAALGVVRRRGRDVAQIDRVQILDVYPQFHRWRTEQDGQLG